MSVYMGLIIKGAIPRGPHHFPYEFGIKKSGLYESSLHIRYLRLVMMPFWVSV